ncbi:LptA/OstA family protein [Oceaniglobus ichthyenteri]|uniref:LptA/OstA family protein n=1 Tax=Oceaniglobus ichthyenteri TaxID=2136177 RepID=UPI000D344494|nr:LptA/OstA family protein [Oceaniglobus ichthyenteri]
MTRIATLATLLMLCGAPALAQGTNIAFGGLKHDTSQPVEVASDSLSIDQADGSAEFSGNVLITQGEMRLSAGAVRVVYAPGGAGQISEMRATGGVTLVNGAEAAEAREAIYSIDKGTVVMTGDVLLTQGQNALSSNTLTINLAAGTGILEGRVRTVFQTGGN